MSRFQSFETETISRNEVKNAAYNPRLMDPESERRLRKGIRDYGLVAPITWNRRTGNVVGGHQRLKQLDTPEVEETKEKIAEVHEARAQSRERLKEANSINWYTVIVFEDEADRADFMKSVSVPVTEEYVTRSQVERIAQRRPEKSHTSRASGSEPK